MKKKAILINYTGRKGSGTWDAYGMAKALIAKGICCVGVFSSDVENKNEIQKILNVAIGGSNFANFCVTEILGEAVKMKAPKIILIHNHPSGDPTPSRQDILTTKRMKEAGEFLGIPLCDHIIIGDQTYLSFREEHMM